jgi:hypothetical protein
MPPPQTPRPVRKQQSLKLMYSHAQQSYDEPGDFRVNLVPRPPTATHLPVEVRERCGVASGLRNALGHTGDRASADAEHALYRSLIGLKSIPASNAAER